MSRTFNVIKAAANGILTLARLGESDQYLLVVTAKDKNLFVPYVKIKGSAFAYIDPDKYDIEDYEALTTIIEAINEAKLFKGVYQFKPISRKAPEHSMSVIGYVKSSGAVNTVPENIKEILEKEGYDVVEKKLATTFKKRDYSELLKNPENRRMFDEDAAELEKVGATYESLPLETKIAYEAIESGKSNGIIFEGPTGTGKSYAARILANHAGAPLLNLQITTGTSVESLIGEYVPNESVDGGKFRFVKGPLLKAFHEGYQLVIEEINYGQPGVNAILNEFTDDTPRITLYGKVYNRHPNFVLYMTMNPGYEGTETLNVALKNRFRKIDVPALTRAQFTERAREYSKKQGHELSAEFFGKLYDFSAVIEKEAESSKWHENVKFSIRNVRRLCDDILQKKRNFDEFAATIFTNYLNDLSTDNDNSEKLQAFKQSKEIVEQIRGIYELYDFAEEKTVKVTLDFDDLFETTGGAAEEDDKADKDEAARKILDRFA